VERVTSASRIADFLGLTLVGSDIDVYRVCTIFHPQPGGVVFANSYRSEFLHLLSSNQECLAIVTNDYEDRLSYPHIISPNPRCDWARVITEFFVARQEPQIAETAIIGPNVSIGHGVSIGDYSVIGENTTIGDHTIIRHHVVIAPGVRIGQACLLKSHCVVGEDGFGFDYLPDGTPIRIPHLGGVFIGDAVEVGSFTTIMRGTVDDTVVESKVKIDDCVLVGHNAHIEENCLLTYCCVGGSAYIKRNTYIGTGANIRNGITVGEYSLVGMGANVTKNVADHVIMIGNPARVMQEND